jgi:phage shock protein A
MGIFDRMGKVIQANLNGLLDRAQDDRKLIQLNLDEMDEQLAAGHQEVVEAMGAEKQLGKRCDDLKADVTRWDGRAELALRSGDEALAREALREKRRLAAQLAQAEAARVEQQATALRMRDDLERMRTKLADLKLRKGTIAARAAQARGGGGAESLGARHGGESAFDAFRRMEEKIESREAQGQAMAEVEEALGKGAGKGGADDLEARFRELERRSGGGGAGSGAGGAGGAGDVEDDLAALKKRIRI